MQVPSGWHVPVAHSAASGVTPSASKQVLPQVVAVAHT